MGINKGGVGMKSKLLLPVLAFCIATATSCNKDIGPGTMDFHYCYVKSQLSGEKYFHISGWKEYDPEPSSAMDNFYVGLELHTPSGGSYYWYEQGLQYMFTKQYVPWFGDAIE